MKKHIDITKDHMNSNNTLFGGELMKWMDDLAHKSANEYCRGRSVTYKVEELIFIKPVYEKNRILIVTKIIEARGSLMKFEIKSFTIKGNTNIINATAIFIMAAIDEEGRPIRIRK